MSEPNELKPASSIDSMNSNTPFKEPNDVNPTTAPKNEYIHTPKQSSLHDADNATMIINEMDLQKIQIEIEQDGKSKNENTENTENVKNEEEEKKKEKEKEKEKEEEEEEAITIPLSPSIHVNTGNTNDSYSQSLSDIDNGSQESITRQTDFTDKAQSPPRRNPLDTTKLRHDGDDVEIGAISDDENSPVITPYNNNNSRMPSISYNNIDRELAALRRASRRKWWSPTRICDWCMHKLFFGKIMVMILTWTTVIDYGKDLYVAYHLGVLHKWWEFSVTLCILFLSLRLMLYLRAIDDSGVSFWKLLIFYLPGSVYADFAIDRFSDIGVCLFWEIAILFGTPFVPFFLIYLAMRKSLSLFSGKNKSFENQYLLSYAVVECIFETCPQLILQTYLYLYYNAEIELIVFVIAWIISILVLIKIPIVVWYNWRIVYKLSFKRRHCGEIMSIKYHPIQDLIASGSWDHTVLISSIINHHNNSTIKAKRVLDHHYNINCIAWMPKFINSLHDNKSDIIAVAGHGIELFNWRMGRSIGQFPKTKERDQLRRKKRHRTKEVKECVFSPDGKRLIWCQGKNVLVWHIMEKRELLKIKCIQGNRLGDVQSIDISPNGKYIACGLYQNQIKVYNSYNKDLIRVLEGHTSPVMCVKFDRQGKYIISGGADCCVRVFDLRFGEEIKQFNKHKSDVMCIAIDYTNKYIASGGRDKTLYITYLHDDDDDDEKYDDHKQQQRKSIIIKPLKELKGWIPYKTQRDIRCCDFSPYGDTLVCASEDHQVHILSLPKECHTKQHRFSTDIGNILHKVHDPQKQEIRNNKLQEIQSNDEAPPDPIPPQIHITSKHQKKFSNLDVITTNDYNKFDPKEHNIF